MDNKLRLFIYVPFLIRPTATQIHSYIIHTHKSFNLKILQHTMYIVLYHNAYTAKQ